MEKKNICVVIPTWERFGMTVETIKRFKKQTLPPKKIVVIGSCEKDMEIPNLIEVDYLQAPNQPLGGKVQKGIEYCRQFEPDALLLCGSDDWLSLNWIETLSVYLDEYDVIGSDRLYALLFWPDKGIEVKKCSYENTDRKGEPVGPGRFVSRRISDKLKWKLYPEDIDSSLDLGSFRELKKVGAKIFADSSDKVKILSPKGDWSTINPWNSYSKFGPSMEDPEQWLEDYFPDALETLRRLTNTRTEISVVVKSTKNRTKIWSDYVSTDN